MNGGHAEQAFRPPERPRMRSKGPFGYHKCAGIGPRTTAQNVAMSRAVEAHRTALMPVSGPAFVGRDGDAVCELVSAS